MLSSDVNNKSNCVRKVIPYVQIITYGVRGFAIHHGHKGKREYGKSKNKQRNSKK